MNDAQKKDVTSADSKKIQFAQLDESHRIRMLHQLILLQHASPGAAWKIKTQPLSLSGFSSRSVTTEETSD